MIARSESPADPNDKKPPVNLLALVDQLGDERFSEREVATEQLIRLGLPALDALEDGRKSNDREIRYRSERIILVVRKLDFLRRLEAFATSRDKEKDFELPGWQKFRDMVGESADSRAMFVKMQKAEPDALAAVPKGPQFVRDLLEARTQQLQQARSVFREELTLGNIATMLFLSIDDQVNATPQANSAIYSFCYQTSFRSAMQSGPNKAIMRKLLGAWIGRSEGWTSYSALNLAMQYELKEGLECAEKLLKAGNTQSHILQQATLAIAKFGDEKHVPLLEGLLKDETRTSSRRVNKVTYETQLRDVALATLIKLTGQNHKDYGFTQLQNNAQLVFVTSTLGFKSDAERQVALKKWQEYRAMKTAVKDADKDKKEAKAEE